MALQVIPLAHKSQPLSVTGEAVVCQTASIDTSSQSSHLSSRKNPGMNLTDGVSSSSSGSGAGSGQATGGATGPFSPASGQMPTTSTPAKPCACPRFLNPFASDTGSSHTSTALQHFCRVCNIRLNSCRQAKIHSDGKKHGKHLHYLKICMEASQADPAPPPATATQSPANSNTTPPFRHVANLATSYPNPQLCTPMSFSGPPCNGFLYHPVAFPQPYLPMSNPYLPALPPQYQPGMSGNFQDLHHALLQMVPSMPPPPPLAPTAPANPMDHVVMPQQQPQHQNMMSPGLTSGFSGSGPDCKSTETSSILSAASLSSSNYRYCEPQHLGYHPRFSKNPHRGYRENYSSLTRGGGGVKQHYDNHVTSSNRYYKQPRVTNHSMSNDKAGNKLMNHVSLPNLTPEHHQQHEIKCEVCQVSVNSSQQLEAHLTGQKHRIRAVRRGLKPDQALASPSSSTLTSATESEHGYPLVSPNSAVNSNNNSSNGKMRRRSSDFNLVRPNGNGQQRQRCFTTGGGGGSHLAPPLALSRHVSSSCLNSVAALRAYSRSTSSLRKAVSHTALSKARSMNLYIAKGRRAREMADDGDDEDEVNPWSNESEEDHVAEVEEEEVLSSEDQQDESGVHTDDHQQGDVDYFENQNSTSISNKASSSSNSSHNHDNNNNNNSSTCLNRNAAPGLSNTTTNGKPKKIKEVKSKESGKKRHQSVSILGGWRQKHNNGNSRSNSSLNNVSNNNNNTSFKEIPMLNVFLQRLNSGSGSNSKKLPVASSVGNDSDEYSNAENC